MQNKLKEILDTLNNLQENLLSLPEDMLLNIDPRDNDSLEQGTHFIRAFNVNLDKFMDIAIEIAEQIKTHFSINPEEEEIEKETVKNQQKQDRIIKELDKTTPHTLDENFTYKRPYGFILGDTAFKGIKTWRNLFILVLDELYEKDPLRFARLPEEEKFISNRGNPLFSREDNLRKGIKLKSELYVEANFSANDIRKNIKSLLEHFQIEPGEMKIYLREDRDAHMQG